MKKKLIALIMVFCMAFSMVACGKKEVEISTKGPYNFNSGKTAKNAFSPNKQETLFGYTFTIPEYMGDKAGNSTSDTIYYYAEQNGKVAMLMVQEFSATGMKEEDIEKNAGSYMTGVKSTLTGYKSYQSDYVKIAGHTGYREYLDCTMAGLTCNTVIYMFYDEGKGKGVSIFWSESENTDFTYFDDVQQIVNSVQ